MWERREVVSQNLEREGKKNCRKGRRLGGWGVKMWTGRDEEK